MEFLNRNIGWRTILLVQFQPQYVCIILIGIFFSSYCVIADLSHVYNTNNPQGRNPIQHQFLIAFDVIYFMDIITMSIYKVCSWDEAKQIFQPRGWVLIIIDFVTCLPICILYKGVKNEKDFVYFYLRTRYSIRNLRIIIYYIRIKKQVGNNPFITTVKEFFSFMGLYMIHINLVIYIMLVKEGYKQTSFILTLYYTICKTTGKGVQTQEDTPHRALTPLLLFSFISYMGYIFYVGSFITALMQTMKGQFVFVTSLERIMNTVRKWKYHSVQMYNTVLRFYTETWKRRQNLSPHENLDFIIPECMCNEIKLDICWNAFKHSHLFRSMDVNYLRYLSKFVTVTYLTPGELVFKKGKFKSKMVYITSGVIQLLSEEDGETPILSLSGGTVLGEASLFIDQPSSCSVVCKNYAEICVLEKKDFFKSYEQYPDEFGFLLQATVKRFHEAQHFVKINKYQIKRILGDTKSQVLTMKWLKKTLTRLSTGEKNKSHIATINLDDRLFETSFQHIIFCSRYLDMMVITQEYELSLDTILLKSTWPIVFQPDSIIINFWKILVAVFALFNALSYVFYVCLAYNYVNLYTLYIYFITFIWIIDVYIQSSTAIKTKDAIIAEVGKIIVKKLSSPIFLVDILAAIPLELICYVMMGDMTVSHFHIFKFNRLLKSYRILILFDISKTTSSRQILIIKYMKLLVFTCILLTNFAGTFYLMMCNKQECTSHFQEFLIRRLINIKHGLKVMVMCYFLSLQFIGGLILGEFPLPTKWVFILAQGIYYFMDMYFIADVSAAETLKNKNKLKYHEFVSNLNVVMKQWEFSNEFTKRVIKYCVLQWEYDNATYLLYQEKLFAHVPFDLFKIGQHISFARSISLMPIFQDLPDEVLALICVNTERHIIPPGEVVTYSGEVCKEMYVIEAGYCEMVAQSRTTARVLGPGDSFSVIETCLNVSTVNTVITLTDCRILSLSHESYIRSLRHHPNVLTEISSILTASIDWVAFEQLLNKEFLDIESYTPTVKSFNLFGYQLDKDSKEYDEFHNPFNKYYVMKILKYILLRCTIKPHGEFIRYWEISRCIFASLTCLLSPITIISHGKTWYWSVFLYFLDATAWADIYVRHHISFFNSIGIEVSHPSETACYYYKHGFAIDLLGVLPFDIIAPAIVSHGKSTSAKTLVYLRLPRLLQGVRVYNMFNFYIYTTGIKAWIILKYFLMVIYLQHIFAFFIINMKCIFDDSENKGNDMYIDNVWCKRSSWISPNESFQHPLTPERVTAYGMYFVATITTFKGLEGFTVLRYGESFEIVLIITFWLCIFPYFSAKLIASVMYRNVDLVVYQNAMNALVNFMRFRKIDPVLKDEVIEHFEYIWHKKNGRNESEIFKVFNIALHEDALFHVYGKAMQNSSIFKGATKSFFKSLLLNFKHEIVLKRGIISRVNNVHGTVFVLFKGQVEVLGPDYNKLLTLPVGSVFGHMDNIARGRQTLTFVAKGHVELLTISSRNFHAVLSKYRTVRTYFKSLTAINVDYLTNANEIVIPDHILAHPEYKMDTASFKKQKPLKTKKLFSCKFCSKSSCWRNLSKSCKHCSACCKNCMKLCYNCCKCKRCLYFFIRIYNRSTFIKIWEGIVLGVICFIGSIVEFYQKSSQDDSALILGILYACDLLFIIKMYLQFHTAYDDERGLPVKDRRLIARRYMNKILGFKIDVISTIPFELMAFFFEGSTKSHVFTYLRMFRLLRVILVIEFFRNMNQKLNINVLLMRLAELMIWVILILQVLVFILFFAAKFDSTMEQYSAYMTKNYKIMTYLRQVKVILHMFTGSQIDSFKPNSTSLIFVTTLMMVFTRFIIAIFIAETCATLETVLHNKTSYESQIEILKNTMLREAVSRPLFIRVWQYVKLLWIHHKGKQFPTLLTEAPYYLREGHGKMYSVLYSSLLLTTLLSGVNILCEMKENPNLLLISTNEILNISLENDYYSVIENNLAKGGAIDYSHKHDTIFFSDVEERNIYKKESNLDKKIIAKNVVAEGLAVDWINEKIYWTNRHKNQLQVSDFDGKNIDVFVKDNITLPRAIAVDPLNNILFWTDWAEPALIESINLNKSKRNQIIKTEIKWPNGITFDRVNRQIFWVDAGLDGIFCSNYNGENRTMIAKGGISLFHPYGIDIFEDWLYWTDWTTKKIHVINSSTRLRRHFTAFSGRPNGLKVYHSSKQKYSKSNSLSQFDNSYVVCIFCMIFWHISLQL